MAQFVYGLTHREIPDKQAWKQPFIPASFEVMHVEQKKNRVAIAHIRDQIWFM